MAELLLMRHAKSSWDEPGLDDFHRPLAPRGRKAAPLVGREIARRHWIPEAVIVSPALRTRQTWARMRLATHVGKAVSFPAPLYMADAETLLAALQATPASVARLLVIGHNPGIEELAMHLAGMESDEDALARLREKFPTAALARFMFEGGWASLQPGTARLTHFLRPRELG